MSAQNGDCSDARTFANEQEGELRWFPWIGDGLVLVEKNWRQAGGGRGGRLAPWIQPGSLQASSIIGSGVGRGSFVLQPVRLRSGSA